MSSFLSPQEPLSEDQITEKLVSHRIFIEEDNYFKNEFDNSIPLSAYDEIIQSLQNQQLVINSNSLNAQCKYNGYIWNQNGTKITITVPGNKSNIAVQKDVINSDNSIICGKLFEIPEQFSIQKSPNRSIITLKVNKQWPILIKGYIPDIDLDSVFFLGLACEKIHKSNIAIKFFVYAALKNHTISIAKLICYYYSNSAHRCFYWNSYLFLSKSTRKFTSTSIISDVLTAERDEGQSAKLAEAILVDCAKNGSNNALVSLGCLHLRKNVGFTNDVKLGFSYLLTASEKSKTAQIALGKCYIAGIGTKANVKYGVSLLQNAGLTASAIRPILKEIAGNKKQNAKSGLGVIGTALVASSITLAIFVVYELFLVRKKG